MTSPLTPDDQALAAEFALGLLDAEGQRLAAEREAASPVFAAEIALWRRHFSAFDRTTPMATLPPDLWSRIEARLDEARATTAATTAGTTAAASRTARAFDEQPSLETSRAANLREQGRLPITSGEAAADARRRLFNWVWNNLAVWRIGALAATAAALVIAAGLGTQLQQARSAPVLVAILQTPDNRSAAIVNAFADGRTELVPLTSFTVPAGKVLEVWTLWDRQVGPRSVGLLAAMASSRLRLDSLPLGADQLFEITLEPAGGSPTGRPTGPVLAIGRTAQRI
ncbi:MAG: anti-sigma factor [Beijerinckiaceae bacterium]|jgi:anti-sigma-K factor RskA|nr:anti-sigma factor [Beijerinckiaceae bacterium]